jgi:non-heme chloroperoxidase
MKIHEVVGGRGLRLHVREWGNAQGIPLLLIHGWSQSHMCWKRQYESGLAQEFRMLALDLRGHGQSESPLAPDEYGDSERWADDIAAIMGQLCLDHPILVGWSYGGYVIADYISKHGAGKISGINFVAAGVVLGPKAFGSLIGPGFLEHAPGACDTDLPTNISAIRHFLRACFRKEMPHEEFEVALAYNMVVHPRVRAFLIQRELDFTAVLQELAVPVQITHSRSDTVVLPAMSEYIERHCKYVSTSWFEGVGHAPFLEEPDRFNQELAVFARETARRPGKT